jgi:dihydropyrimidinase
MLIRGGPVWDERSGRRTDVRVEGGKVVELGDLQPRPDEEVLDAGGLHVLPGMIDAHVHAGDRIGRFELADSWESASRAALATGITTLAGFVTQQQDETLTAAVDRCTARAAGAGCEVRFHLTPTVWPWDWDEVAALISRGFTTFKLYTTYREAGLFSSYERLAEVMPRLAELGATLLVHCEDDALLLDPEAVDADLADPYSHARLRPEAAEVEAVRRVVELAESSGCRVHVVHVSTADAAELVTAARRRGAPVSCETAPHYLLLESSCLGDPDGSRTLCTPPLRSEATRQQLETLAVAGAFDLLATDHCAFTRKDKDGWSGSDFRVLPFGIAGVGALVPLAYELLVRRHGRPMAELVRLLAAGPARLLGIYPRKGVLAVGSDADLAIVDPDGPRRPIRSSEADAWETWSGRATTWTPRHVLRNGVRSELGT